VRYHCRWSSEWICRLGDGTEESRQRLLNAIDNLWPYTGELFIAAPYETALKIDTAAMATNWIAALRDLFAEATLPAPSLDSTFMHTGGKTGQHTELLGYILAEMQYVQRSYPGCEW
jgi:ring-1,2-phenylacetyl-CoA epoxidase subunit PaaC